MAFAGFAFGLVYFAMLRRTIALFTEGRGLLGPLLLTARADCRGHRAARDHGPGRRARLACDFLGFLVARGVALRMAGRLR